MLYETLKRFPNSIKYTNLQVYVYSLLGSTKRNENSPKQHRLTEISQRGGTDQIALGQTENVMDNPNTEKPKRRSLENTKKA